MTLENPLIPGVARALFVCMICGLRPAAATEDVESPWYCGWSREQKTLAFNLGMAAAVSAYGFAQWDWGTSSFEYFPTSEVRSGRDADIFTDYEGSRWMLAFPLRAWLDDESWLDWFDVLVGYGTRDFEGRRRGSRHPFIGIGISLPLANEKFRVPGPGRVWEYIQVPGAAWPLPP